MQDIEKALQVPEIQSGTKFWMIRTKQGLFFDEFLRESYIGIGWNTILRDDLTISSDILKAKLKMEYGEKAPGSALSKCIRFCQKMQKDDIVMIVDKERIAFARVGEYYEENRREWTLEYEQTMNNMVASGDYDYKELVCPYKKRRRIALIGRIGELKRISPYLLNAISGNLHSLSSMDKYGELMLSACLDAFIYRNKLTLTCRVAQRKDINLCDFQDLLTASKLFYTYSREDVKIKAALHSPGDVLLQVVNFVKDNPFPVLLFYLFIFGGRAKDYEFPSLSALVGKLLRRKYHKKKEELELRKLKAEVRLKELELIEKESKMDYEALQKCANELIQAAGNLDITPTVETLKQVKDLIEQIENEPDYPDPDWMPKD